MTNAVKLKLDAVNVAVTLNAVVDKAKECPVILGFQGHEGEFVLMTADQYADLIEPQQTVEVMNILDEPMLQNIEPPRED
jgi:hypothetical protein